MEAVMKTDLHVILHSLSIYYDVENVHVLDAIYSVILQNTALHYACFGGHVEAVQLLLEYKADVAVKNTYHQSPLDHAVDNMNNDVVTVMLRNKRSAS